MRILIYTPTNSRAVDLQSVMELFVKMGHDVYFLSQLPEGDLHINASKLGVKAYGETGVQQNGFLSYYYHYRKLTKFIKENRIEVVFAHLQGAGVLCGFAKLFHRFRFFYVRHNTDEHRLQKSRKAGILNQLTNWLAPVIIAPSEKVFRYLVQVEKIRPSKITRINYGYNFQQYLDTDKTGKAEEIRKKYDCSMLVVSVARLIPVKRHLLMFEVIQELIREGSDIKMICLGEGSYRQVLQNYIDSHSLQENIFLLGVQKNVFDYLEAGDLFFHLSATEASNSAVKEAGFCRKIAIVCNDVGDFDDYVKDGINGFIVDKEKPVERSVSVMREVYKDSQKRRRMGDAIYATIINEFVIERVQGKYAELLNYNFAG